MGSSRLKSSVKFSGFLTAALLVTATSSLHAQVTGTLTGTVTDADTGEPLPGAQIRIESARIGSVSAEDGFYVIMAVPVGERRASATLLGYATRTQTQLVLPGQTVTLDFHLRSEPIAAEEIVAVTDHEPLVVRGQFVSATRFTAREARELPVEDIRSLVSLGAGAHTAPRLDLPGLLPVSKGGEGFVIRGGRVTESATYVDGVLVTDFTQQQTWTDAPLFGVEEVDLVTGGLGAEIGHAQSGIVNIVTREGGPIWTGTARVTLDPGLATDGDREDGPSRCCGYRQLLLSLGGPLLEDRLTTFGSLELMTTASISPRGGGFNPLVGTPNSSGTTESILPGQRGDRIRSVLKLTSFPWTETRLSGTWLFTRNQQEGYESVRSVHQEWSLASRIRAHDAILAASMTPLRSPDRSLHLDLRGHYHHTEVAFGTPVSVVAARAIAERIGVERCGTECRVDEDAFATDFLGWRLGETRFFFEDSVPSTVFELPETSRLEPDPVFGMPNLWANTGMSSEFGQQTERRTGVRFDLDGRLGRVHGLKAGFEWTWLDLSRRHGSLDDFNNFQSYDVEPRIGALYVADRLDFGDLVIDAGLRWDHWDPNTRFPTLPGRVSCDLVPGPDFLCTPGAEIQDARSRNALAPRFGVAHPATDRTQVRVSWGRFYQLPELEDFFDGFLVEGGGLHGNPKLDFIETTALEGGITHLLNEDWVLDVVGYNRDRRGAVRAEFFDAGALDPTLGSVGSYTNGDHGNVRGLELVLRRRFAGYFSTEIASSLQWARGTTSSPLDWASRGTAISPDPLNDGRFFRPPTSLKPDDYDRLLSFDWILSVRFPNDFRPGTLAGSVLRNAGLFSTFNARSGTPYTRREIGGARAEEDNQSRNPWTQQANVRVAKAFGPWEGFDLEGFVTVRNLFDVENLLDVNDATGIPGFTGLEERLSRRTPISDRYKVEDAPGGFPIPLEAFLEEYRDDFRKHDLDGDGLLTQAETDEVHRRALLAGNDSAYFYGEPRQVRFGVEVRF